MIITIAFYALLVFGYFYAVGKIWRGESEFDGDDPPAFWPFSDELWRGTGRAAFLVSNGKWGANGPYQLIVFSNP